jgi:hypothetical protein
MFRITKTLKPINFDFSAYKRQLEDELSESLARAAFQWLVTATGLIPVWSGASHGTFSDLANAIGFVQTIEPAATAPADESRYGKALSDGNFVADVNKGLFYFEYSTELPHLVYNEYNNANVSPDPTLRHRLINPGPYHFQIAARQAYEQEIKNFVPPNPFIYVSLGK